MSLSSADFLLKFSQPDLGLMELPPQLGLGLTGQRVDEGVGDQLGRGDAPGRVLVHQGPQQGVELLEIIREVGQHSLFELLVTRDVLGVTLYNVFDIWGQNTPT